MQSKESQCLEGDTSKASKLSTLGQRVGVAVHAAQLELEGLELRERHVLLLELAERVCESRVSGTIGILSVVN